MLDFLAIARVVLQLCVDAYRLYRRNLMQPLLTAIFLTVSYAVVHVTQEGNLSTGLRSAFFDNDATRAERRRANAQTVLQGELRQVSATNKLVDQYLETLLERAGASRVRLDVIHNGVSGLTGTGLLRYDVTNAVAAPGRSPGTYLQNESLSNWSDFLPTLLSGKCAVLRVSDLHSPLLRSRFEGFGADSVMICPAADVEGRTLGALFTFWDGSDQMPKGNELSDLLEAGRHIGGQVAAVLDVRGPPADAASAGSTRD